MVVMPVAAVALLIAAAPGATWPRIPTDTWG